VLRWVRRGWSGTHLALARDATTLGDRCVVLAVSVRSRGWALPVAWTVVPAQPSSPWRTAWVRRLRHLRPAVPPTLTVLGLADRGLDARWLFRRIVRLGGPPLLRVNAGGTVRPDGHARFQRVTTFAPQPGTRWRGRGTACTWSRPLACTLVACWEEDTAEPWGVLTDLPPEVRDACGYGRRAWSEPGVTLTTRAGWPWHRPRMTAPARTTRLWLAGAGATLWLLRGGGDADETSPESTLRERHGGPHPAATPPTGHPSPSGERLSPGLGADPDSPPSARPAPPRTLRAGTPAGGARHP
jgi:hypothetical protein